MIRLLLHTAKGERAVVDPEQILYLEAAGHQTKVESVDGGGWLEVRELGQVEPVFADHGFLRVHDEFIVNLRRVAWIRRREHGRDWELELEPPSGRVIPIARARLASVWKAYDR